MNDSVFAKYGLDFFLLCAKAQKISGEDVQKGWEYIHANRFEQIPVDAKAPFPQHEEQLKIWFQQFLSLKYKFHHLLLTGDPSDKDIERELAIDLNKNQWGKIIHLWREQADSERLAYLYRVSQIGPVHSKTAWYNTLPEFTLWSDLCRERVLKLFDKMESDARFELYANASCNWNPPRTFEEEAILSIIQGRIMTALSDLIARTVNQLTYLENINGELDWFKEYLEDSKSLIPASLSYSDLYKSSLCESPVMRVINATHERFRYLLNSEGYNRFIFLQCFNKIISDVYECELSDYLIVNTEGQLEIASTSLDISESDLHKKLGDSEVYEKGEGITGSVLINPHPNAYVGTNNLEDDPRQSPWHKSDYEKIYGPSYNFWVFPVFEKGAVSGAIRVVNRVDSRRDANLGYWPLYIRQQIMETARWFEQFWSLMNSILISSTSTLNGNIHHKNGNIHHKKEVTLKESLELQWISPMFLADLLRRLEQIAHIKIERKRVGCTVAVIDSTELEVLEDHLSEFTLKNDVTISELSSCCADVPFLVGMFVYDGTGAFVNVFELELRVQGEARIICGLDCVTDLMETLDDIVVFSLEAGKDMIRVFRKGEMAAEYYLSHYSGAWTLRMYNDNLDRLLNNCRKSNSELLEKKRSERSIKLLYKYAWGLSYHEKGSLVILADELPDAISMSGGRSIGKSLWSMSEEIFMSYAEKDGAIIVSPDGIVKSYGKLLQVNVDPPNAIKSRLDKHGCGARHTAAARFSTACPDAVVIVTSENRGITILYGGKVVCWRI